VPRKNKFNAQPVVADGHRFDSTAEYHRWLELRHLEAAGTIRNLKHHTRLPLEINGKPILIRSDRYKRGRAVKYEADFIYFENEKRVIEDVKGMDTAYSRLKRAVTEAIYNVEIKIVRVK